jgi:hypothetical protein
VLDRRTSGIGSALLAAQYGQSMDVPLRGCCKVAEILTGASLPGLMAASWPSIVLGSEPETRVDNTGGLHVGGRLALTMRLPRVPTSGTERGLQMRPCRGPRGRERGKTELVGGHAVICRCRVYIRTNTAARRGRPVLRGERGKMARCSRQARRGGYERRSGPAADVVVDMELRARFRGQGIALTGERLRILS